MNAVVQKHFLASVLRLSSLFTVYSLCTQQEKKSPGDFVVSYSCSEEINLSRELDKLQMSRSLWKDYSSFFY